MLLARGGGATVGQVHLEPHLLRPIEVLADDLGLVKAHWSEDCCWASSISFMA